MMQYLLMLALISLVLSGTALSNSAYTAENPKAFLQPDPGLSASQKLDFQVGRGFFRRLWVSAPASTQAADGLGPLFNARACMSCHPRNGRGHPPEGPDDNAISLLLRIDVPASTKAEKKLLAEHRLLNIPEPHYGEQLQDFALSGHDAEYQLKLRYEETIIDLDGEPVSLRKPHYQLSHLGYGPLHPQARISPRVAPAMIGLGLLEAIPEQDILSREDPQDLDGDGISGRANRVWDAHRQKVSLGRFGLKAGMPSVDQQSQAAFVTDMGLSTPLYPRGAGDCTLRQAKCQRAPNGNSPQYGNLEISQEVSDLVSFYVAHIAVPPRRNTTSADVLAGERWFSEVGCASCHIPQIEIGESIKSPVHAKRSISPYTDLLLHDMGEGLADHRPEGAATGREWRTAPLWGIGLTKVVTGKENYLHDGRARTLTEAILWHGGEAKGAKERFSNLPRVKRRQLLSFLKSL